MMAANTCIAMFYKDLFFIELWRITNMLLKNMAFKMYMLSLSSLRIFSEFLLIINTFCAL